MSPFVRRGDIITLFIKQILHFVTKKFKTYKKELVFHCSMINDIFNSDKVGTVKSQ